MHLMRAGSNGRRFAVLPILGALALLAMPGTAVGGPGCPDGAYCLWKKADYQGEKLVVKSNGLINLPRFINNKASSLKNRNDDPVFLYTGKNGNGGSTCYDPGQNVGIIGVLNNAISSADVRSDPCL